MRDLFGYYLPTSSVCACVVFSIKSSDFDFKQSFVFANVLARFVTVIIFLLISSVSLPLPTFIDGANSHEVCACVRIQYDGREWYSYYLRQTMTLNWHLRLNSYAFILVPTEFKCASKGFFLHSVYFWFTPHGVIWSENKAKNFFLGNDRTFFYCENQNKYSTKIVTQSVPLNQRQLAAVPFICNLRDEKKNDIAITAQ